MLIEDHDSRSAARTAMEDGEISSSDSSSPDSSSGAIADKNPSVAETSSSASSGDGNDRKTKSGRGWWALSGVFALILIALTIAAGYLITRRPTTVDQIVILTVPSGAEVKLNSRDYGQTPVKIEHLPIGTYTLTITKDHFQTEVDQINISESDTLEYKLKLELPAGSGNLSPEQQMKQYSLDAEEAFAASHYAIPYDESALYYAQVILQFDESNEFASGMLERIRLALLQSAEAARRRHDMRQAKEIYSLLIQHYPGDRDVIAARAKFESELSSRRGDARALARKAEEALMQGNLIDPVHASAYYYSTEALTLEPQNAQALTVLGEVKQRLVNTVEQYISLGDTDTANKQLKRFEKYFDDRQTRDRLKEMIARSEAESAKTNDPNHRRIEGLEKYRGREYHDAIRDLEFAIVNGSETPDALFALAHSYLKIGRSGQAMSYFEKISPAAGETYNSAQAIMGEIAFDRGDTEGALRRYREARQRGGSIMYPTSTLDYRIERIERRQQEKAAEPSLLSIRVRHLHSGILRGSCEGELTVSPTGVVYRSVKGDNYSANLVGLRVQVDKDELTVFGFVKNPQKFKATGQDAERFRETLGKFQNAIK